MMFPENRKKVEQQIGTNQCRDWMRCYIGDDILEWPQHSRIQYWLNEESEK